MDITAECRAYEWVKDLVVSGQATYVDQIIEITGYDRDFVGRVCIELYREGHIRVFWGIRRII